MATTSDPLSIVDDDHVYLDPWEELAGELVGITVSNGRVIVELSGGTLAYPTRSVEADQLQKELTGMEGRTVGILRTDDTASPLAITLDME
jgi:hypothetical protein